MLAVIKTGGKQYIVSPGSRIKVEKLDGVAGDTVSFGEVLLAASEDGADVKIGTPFAPGMRVSGKIIAQGRHKKISMLKYKPKKRYRLRKGHRQHFTEVEIQESA